jgi:AAA family ATP:ADP antiporter
MSASDRGDRDAVAAATFAAGLLIAQQVAGRTVRDAFFLSELRVESLPLMMMTSAVLALAGAEAMSVALSRRSPFRVMPVAAAASAVLFALEWGLSRPAPQVAAVLVYLHVAGFGGALVSGFWSLVNERFDPYTARQVVGRIGTGATAGGVAGGLLALAASRVLSVPTTLLLLSLLHGLGTLALLRARGPGPPAVTSGERTPVLALPLLARAPYLRTLALVVLLGAVTDALFDFLFKAKTVELVREAGQMMTVFALFHTGLSLLGFLCQWTLARPALGRLGLAGTVALRPAVDVVAGLVGAAVPRFATATLARGAHETLTHSLFRSGYELLYTPLPEAEKRRVKAVVDVAVDKAGTLVGGALVAAVLAVVPVGMEPRLFALGAGVSLVGLVLSRRLHVGYVRALEQSLLAGQVRLDPADVHDRTTELTLAHTGVIERGALLSQIEALRGERTGSDEASSTETAPGGRAALLPAPRAPLDPLIEDLEALRSGRRKRVQEVLRSNPEPGPLLVAGLIPLLSRDELYPDVVRTLRRVAARVSGQLVDALLDQRMDPVVRRRIPRVLKTCPDPRSSDGLLAALDDPAFAVRASSAVALAALHGQGAEMSVPRERVLERVRSELERPAGGERQLAHVFTLLSLALEPEPLRIAWAALRGRDRALRGTALEYLDTVLPDEIFVPLSQRCGGAVAAKPVPRSAARVAADLRASSVNLRLERPPWGGGEGEGMGPDGD